MQFSWLDTCFVHSNATIMFLRGSQELSVSHRTVWRNLTRSCIAHQCWRQMKAAYLQYKRWLPLPWPFRYSTAVTNVMRLSPVPVLTPCDETLSLSQHHSMIPCALSKHHAMIPCPFPNIMRGTPALSKHHALFPCALSIHHATIPCPCPNIL
jgi:hypothetical protein